MTEVFARPEIWPLLLAAPLAWLVLRRLDGARERRLADLVGPRTHAVAPDFAPKRRALRRVLVCAGVACAVVAALRPLVFDAAEATEARGPDVVVCLDVSRSMLARDVAPSRLASAKRGVRDVAARAGDGRLALVAFAGDARLVAPLTADMDSFADLADTVDPTTVTRGGTDLGVALDAALDALRDVPDGRGAVLLVTDGEDLGGRGRAAAERCRARGFAVHCVGLGTPLGSKIVVESGRGEAFVTDKAGAAVVSSMDAAGLTRIADATGGSFTDGTPSSVALRDVFTSRVVPTTKKALEKAERRRQVGQFQAPLLAAILLWLVDLSLTDRRRA
jgi:Ca-activated chloride channel family protein